MSGLIHRDRRRNGSARFEAHSTSNPPLWVVVVERVPEEDDGYSHIVDVTAENQSSVTTIGLAHFVAQQRSTALSRE